MTQFIVVSDQDGEFVINTKNIDGAYPIAEGTRINMRSADMSFDHDVSEPFDQVIALLGAKRATTTQKTDPMDETES